MDRNRGKQPGAPGQNLSMRSDPDETFDHEPSCCVSCGEDLGDAPVEGIERRQVFDTRTRSSSPSSTARSADGARVGR